MKKIQLTQGKVAIVADADYEKVNQYKWYFDNGYAARTINYTKPKSRIRMHRYIWEINNGPIPEDKEIDHINLNRSDNRLENLRLVTRSENFMNRRGYKNSSSRFKGVSFYKTTNKWRAYICKDRHITHIGYYDSEIDAAKTYNCYAIILHGKYACLNDWEGKNI